MSTAPTSLPNEPDFAWEVARLFPAQGEWDEGEYLRLTESTNSLVEFTDGRIEVLELPTTAHQLIVEFLFEAIRAIVKPRQLGTVLFAPLRVRIRKNKFREPDILFMRQQNRERRGNDYWQGADLVMEVVSPSHASRARDIEMKPADYAEARIPEYWIIDPVDEQITVLRLDGDHYTTHGQFARGEQASSALLDGFSVHVAEVFDAAKS